MKLLLFLHVGVVVAVKGLILGCCHWFALKCHVLKDFEEKTVYKNTYHLPQKKRTSCERCFRWIALWAMEMIQSMMRMNEVCCLVDNDV